MEPQSNNVTEVTKILSKNQKHFIGLVLAATGIIFFLLSIMLFVTLLILIGFNFKIFIELISNGQILAGLMLALLTTGILSFSIGISLQNK